MAYNPFALMNCPDQVTWSNDIRQLFTQLDVDHMKIVRNIDLSDYDSVKIWAVPIYDAVASGYMPAVQSGQYPWSADMINTFGCWIKQGCPR